MQKQKLVGKRVSVNSGDWFFNRGETGEIIDVFNGGLLSVVMDGYFDQKNKPLSFPFVLSDLYFPNDVAGYNQKCFQNNI